MTLTRSNTHFVGPRVWRGLFAGLTVPGAGQGPYSIAHPDFRDWLEEEFQHLPPVTVRPYVETESGPRTDGFRGR